MTAWQKFLKETIPSRKIRKQLQIFMGKTIASSPQLKKYKVYIALKYQEGLTFTVLARDEKEAEVIALNKPECSALIDQNPLIGVWPVNQCPV